MATKRKTQNIYEDEVDDLADEGDDTDSDSEEVDQRRPAADDTGDADDTDRDDADGGGRSRPGRQGRRPGRGPHAAQVQATEGRAGAVEEDRRQRQRAPRRPSAPCAWRTCSCGWRPTPSTTAPQPSSWRDLSKVEVADDGTITGMEDVDRPTGRQPPVPHPDSRTPSPTTDWQPPDLPSGRPMNGPRHDPAVKAGANDAALLKRYPAFQRRRGW